jgi:hypothetical protein
MAGCPGHPRPLCINKAMDARDAPAHDEIRIRGGYAASFAM